MVAVLKWLVLFGFTNQVLVSAFGCHGNLEIGLSGLSLRCTLSDDPKHPL